RSRLIWLAAATAVALAVVARFDVAALPEVGRHRDDAYYYFDFVRNLVSGCGPRIGAGEPTNGVHVGQALLLVPLHLAAGDRGLVEGSRWLGLALLLGAALVFAHAARRHGLGAGATAVLAAALAGDAFLIDEAQNGQETALAVFASTVLVAARGAATPRFTA